MAPPKNSEGGLPPPPPGPAPGKNLNLQTPWISRRKDKGKGATIRWGGGDRFRLSDKGILILCMSVIYFTREIKGFICSPLNRL